LYLASRGKGDTTEPTNKKRRIFGQTTITAPKNLMIKTFSILAGILILTANSYAQGTISFVNNSSTLVTLINEFGMNLGATPGTLGGYRYELFVAPAGTSNPNLFTTTGLIATNTTTGRFSGGVLAIPGYVPGETVSILIRGWAAILGTNYLSASPYFVVIGSPTGHVGQSSIALNFVLGGFDGSTTLVTRPAFGGSQGIQTGFSLFSNQFIPEPTTSALTMFGLVALAYSRRP
jgi:hypothetical protein